MKHVTRYLGSMLHVDLFTCSEMESRISSMRVAWQATRRFLMAGQIKQIRRIVFKPMVYNSGLSGLEAFVLIAGQMQKFNNVIVKYARAMMRGNACKKTMGRTLQ